MKIGLIYFSATGNTKLIAQKIKRLLKRENFIISEYDITSLKSRMKDFPLDDNDFVIFGFPIYGRKAPKAVRDWIEKLPIIKKPSALFFTYGGPMRGDVHNLTRKQLESKGFTVIGSAEILAKHSFNLGKGFSLMENHPNEADMRLVEEYIEKLVQKINAKNFESLNFPIAEDNLTFPSSSQQNNEKPRPTVDHPKRISKDCSMCYDCEEECSTGAFNAEKGIADKSKCIMCFRCVAICPDNVIHVNDLTEFYKSFRERLSLTDELLASRVSRYFI